MDSIELVWLIFQQVKQLVEPRSVLLTMISARDCYASTLKRNGCAIEEIVEQLTHSDIATKAHYVDSFAIEKSRIINESL